MFWTFGKRPKVMQLFAKLCLVLSLTQHHCHIAVLGDLAESSDAGCQGEADDLSIGQMDMGDGVIVTTVAIRAVAGVCIEEPQCQGLDEEEEEEEISYYDLRFGRCSAKAACCQISTDIWEEPPSSTLPNRTVLNCNTDCFTIHSQPNDGNEGNEGDEGADSESSSDPSLLMTPFPAPGDVAGLPAQGPSTDPDPKDTRCMADAIRGATDLVEQGDGRIWELKNVAAVAGSCFAQPKCRVDPTTIYKEDADPEGGPCSPAALCCNMQTYNDPMGFFQLVCLDKCMNISEAALGPQPADVLTPLPVALPSMPSPSEPRSVSLSPSGGAASRGLAPVVAAPPDAEKRADPPLGTSEGGTGGTNSKDSPATNAAPVSCAAGVAGAVLVNVGVFLAVCR